MNQLVDDQSYIWEKERAGSKVKESCFRTVNFFRIIFLYSFFKLFLAKSFQRQLQKQNNSNSQEQKSFTKSTGQKKSEKVLKNEDGFNQKENCSGSSDPLKNTCFKLLERLLFLVKGNFSFLSISFYSIPSIHHHPSPCIIIL